MAWFVYILESSTGKKSYVGKTNDPKRRLRQHNGERSGGARYTRGGKWKIKYLFYNIPDETTALQFECNLKARYRCKVLSALKKDAHIKCVVKSQMRELAPAPLSAASKRLREALFVLQKPCFTKRTKHETKNLDIKIATDPDVEKIDALV